MRLMLLQAVPELSCEPRPGIPSARRRTTNVGPLPTSRGEFQSNDTKHEHQVEREKKQQRKRVFWECGCFPVRYFCFLLLSGLYNFTLNIPPTSRLIALKGLNVFGWCACSLLQSLYVKETHICAIVLNIITASQACIHFLYSEV